jgi:ankyrin repeat protein
VGSSALSRAAKQGHSETVGLLLDRKAEIDAADDEIPFS